MRTFSKALIWSITLLTALSAAVIVQAASFTIRNQSSREMVELYVAEASSQNWGSSVLGRSPIAASEERSISVNGDCPCRLKAVYEDGYVSYQQGVGPRITFVH